MTKDTNATYSRKTYLKAKTHFLKDTNMNAVLVPNNGVSTFTNTKLVATIGPACQTPDVLAEMLDSGVVGARIDLTWAPLDYHRRSLDNLQAAMRKSKKLCSIMIDTLGRELMVRREVKIQEDGWPYQEDPLNIKAGDTITLTTRDVPCTASTLPIMFSKFPGMVEKGDTIYIGRYLVCGADSASLYIEVMDIKDTDVICVAKNDAVLDGLLTVFHAERSADTLLNVQNDLPLLSDYDKQCLQLLSQEYEIDFVSLSYCRSAEDIREAKRFLEEIGMDNTRVLAKVETRQSLLNFQGILNEADGIIMSRGNLGLDCVPEKMALIQKIMVQACNLVGKPILITRLCDTMVTTPRPTRAEATDVANAVLDGVDGFLLGAETLRGKYPVETVKTISSICRSAEEVFDCHYHYEHLMEMALDNDDTLLPGMTPGDSDDDSLAPHGEMSFRPGQSRLSATSGPMPRDDSYGSLNMAVKAMAKFSTVASSASLANLGHSGANGRSASALYHQNPYVSKLESIASSAVRAADRVGASLIVVYTHTGKTAQLVSKYRPPIPILTLVVPHLVSDQLKWRLEGRSNARQCLLSRGLLPMLAAPSPSGDALLEEAVAMAGRMGLVKARDHVVCVQRIHDDFCVKIIAVDDLGTGIKRGMASSNNLSMALSAMGPLAIPDSTTSPNRTNVDQRFGGVLSPTATRKAL